MTVLYLHHLGVGVEVAQGGVGVGVGGAGGPNCYGGSTQCDMVVTLLRHSWRGCGGAISLEQEYKLPCVTLGHAGAGGSAAA